MQVFKIVFGIVLVTLGLLWSLQGGGLDPNETHPLCGPLRTHGWRLHGMVYRWVPCDGCWPWFACVGKAQTLTLYLCIFDSQGF